TTMPVDGAGDRIDSDAVRRCRQPVLVGGGAEPAVNQPLLPRARPAIWPAGGPHLRRAQPAHHAYIPWRWPRQSGMDLLGQWPTEDGDHQERYRGLTADDQQLH